MLEKHEIYQHFLSFVNQPDIVTEEDAVLIIAD